METFSGFTSEASVSGQPHTPPYTPLKNKGKRRLERSDSPASSIHPAETTSPAKKAAKRTSLAKNDNVKVEELAESETYKDAEIVYPEETEEIGSEGDGDDELSVTSDSGAEPSDGEGISRGLSRLHCKDEQGEAKFEKGRRQRRMSRRNVGPQVFKRSHSQSVGSRSADATDVDADAMDDQDLMGSQRRLRRRTRGPAEDDFVFEELPRSSPDPGSVAGRVGSRRVSPSNLHCREPVTPERVMDDMDDRIRTARNDPMDVDEDDD